MIGLYIFGIVSVVIATAESETSVFHHKLSLFDQGPSQKATAKKAVAEDLQRAAQRQFQRTEATKETRNLKLGVPGHPKVCFLVGF